HESTNHWPARETTIAPVRNDDQRLEQMISQIDKLEDNVSKL
ncbi:hypothetical protein O5169_28570, partial [Escherichia coli]|nr:hypothetical protein [Escherichia coli]